MLGGDGIGISAPQECGPGKSTGKDLSVLQTDWHPTRKNTWQYLRTPGDCFPGWGHMWNYRAWGAEPRACCQSDLLSHSRDGMPADVVRSRGQKREGVEPFAASNQGDRQ